MQPTRATWRAIGLLGLLLLAACCPAPAAPPGASPTATQAGEPTIGVPVSTASTPVGTAVPIATPTPAPTATVAPTGTPRPIPAARREEFAVDFGDFTSTVRLHLPAGHGPFPTILVLSGSGPDHVGDQSYAPLTAALVARGYAVARYTKHYVYAPSHGGATGDYLREASAYMRQVPPKQLLADADRAYRAVAARPAVDPRRLVLYGQSEGGTIAAQLALAHPESAGVVLHGTPARAWAEDERAFHFDFVLPFLREIVDTDADGALTAGELLEARAAWSRSALAFALDYLVAADGAVARMPNPRVDADGDGRLTIDGEIRAAYDARPGDYDARFPGQGPDSRLPAVGATLPGYRRPVLVQQGGRDAYVDPADGARIDAALAAAAHPDHTLRLYPELGHALGPAESRYRDPILPPAPGPLADLLGWLDARYRSAPGAVAPTTRGQIRGWSQAARGAATHGA